jgi:hypothetical protein
MTEFDVRQVHLAAQLHDVGKSAIPDSILHKPGPLDHDEWEFMRRHTLIGERIARAASSISHAAPLIRSSHERVDGTGYPDRLLGDQILLGARIIAVCDAFDAMIADRSYRIGMSISHALEELQRCAGAQFDPHVVTESAGLPGSNLTRRPRPERETPAGSRSDIRLGDSPVEPSPSALSRGRAGDQESGELTGRRSLAVASGRLL